MSGKRYSIEAMALAKNSKPMKIPDFRSNLQKSAERHLQGMGKKMRSDFEKSNAIFKKVKSFKPMNDRGILGK